jgi:hypothetical protein
MKIPFDKSKEIEDLFNDKQYLHYESAMKILDILEINYEGKWIKNVRFELNIKESSTYNENKIIKFLDIAKNVCRDCANGYQVDEGEALDSIMVLEDVIKILKE